MITVSIAELKDKLSHFLNLVAQGKVVEVSKRNIPIARLAPIASSARNRTKLGCGRGTGVILGSPLDPMISGEDWEMLSSAEPTSKPSP